ncbi:MAG: hypothetical protein CMD26_02700 [Flavobacteriales bacterium]|nr:hypothetical protein [Flavobacteriales bacterium]|tara:strand:- start:5471 stop:6088 length:618 start_codon:yes stop_codon:yes gene_type:complete
MSFIDRLKIVAGITKNDSTNAYEANNLEVSKDDPVDVIFAKKLIQNNGIFFYCDKKENLIKTMQALNKKLKINTIYCTEQRLQNLLEKSDIEYNSENYTSCDAIISSCEYLIAHHGKIMLSSKQLGSNAIKNLPKEHIVVAYTSQIVKNLNDAMSGINTRYIDNLPSTITTIASSREHNNNNILEGNIKNISVLLIEDFQDQKLI